MAQLDFSVDHSSPVPPFKQLHDAVVAAVASGALAPGSRLPTVRALAAELGLATNTVAGAYRALEESGVAEGRGRQGTFVRVDAAGGDPVEVEARRIALEAAAALSRLGVDRARALRLLSDAYDA